MHTQNAYTFFDFIYEFVYQLYKLCIRPFSNTIKRIDESEKVKSFSLFALQPIGRNQLFPFDFLLSGE